MNKQHAEEVDPTLERLHHVLVVDDCRVQRRITEMLFSRSACKVTTAESGNKAWEILLRGPDKHTTSHHINLVMTDYDMPGMTGLDLLKKIKESSDTKEIPVFIYSSDNKPTRIQEYLKEGAEGFFLKPLKLSDVKDVLEKLLLG